MGFLFWEYGCNCAVFSDWKVKMYDFYVRRLVMIIEYNLHNAICTVETILTR